MKIQQTYIFVFILQTIIASSAALGLLWSFIMSADVIPFIVLLILSIFFSGSVFISFRDSKLNIDKTTCLIAIFITWFLLIIMGSIPFYIMLPDKNIFDVLFLSITLTTTFGSWPGLPVIFDHEFLIWQSILQWLGGLTTILIATFLIEFILSKNKLNNDHFNIDNLKIISLLYIFLTIVFAFLLYYFESYSLDHSLRLSMALMSTSNSFEYDGSIIIRESYQFKLIMISAMIFGAISISAHYKSLNYGILSYFRNKNFIAIIIFSLIFVIFIALYISKITNTPLFYTFIDTLFLVISFITTTGLIPYDFLYSGVLNKLLLLIIIFSLIGGAINSTTGGLKASRIIFVTKFIYRELYKLGNPRIILSKENLGLNDNALRIFVFCIIFLFSVLILSLFLSIVGINFKDSILIILGAITNSGVGIMQISNIIYYPETSTEILIISLALLIGRVEIFYIMLITSSYLWKNR